MSRRSAAIVEEFDDDTDLPLPSKPLANTGSRGALLQSINDDDEDEEEDDGDETGDEDKHLADEMLSPALMRNPAASASNPATPSHAQQQFDSKNLVTDLTPYKKWTCVYPIYLDAKRSYGAGSRRIQRSKALWWPLSKDIAEASSRLGLGTLHEISKCHPRDWENPGRVRVQWKKDGKVVNPVIKTKKQLLELLSATIQTLKPELIPKPPFSIVTNTNLSITNTQAVSKSNTKSSSSAKGKSTSTAPPASTSTPGPNSSSKSKQAVTTTSSSLVTTTSPSPAPLPTDLLPRAHQPVPPSYPPLSARLSAYSPALPSGMLIETIKAGMSGDAAAAGGVGPGGMGAGGKGKRKVVRVRG